ncbi:flocculation protein FLO11-like [Acanthaster planci]|uniref:Flocculation protein FLO11-like n=1 Tax=Acanthaster planci TaxID=133434 RepID=A0A8B8A304_ACAPL|nr:flocculation protein FLO11-like [Acanthaster planci]
MTTNVVTFTTSTTVIEEITTLRATSEISTTQSKRGPPGGSEVETTTKPIRSRPPGGSQIETTTQPMRSRYSKTEPVTKTTISKSTLTTTSPRSSTRGKMN